MRHLQMEVNHVNHTKGIPFDSDQTQTALSWDLLRQSATRWDALREIEMRHMVARTRHAARQPVIGVRSDRCLREPPYLPYVSTVTLDKVFVEPAR